MQGVEPNTLKCGSEAEDGPPSRSVYFSWKLLFHERLPLPPILPRRGAWT